MALLYGRAGRLKSKKTAVSGPDSAIMDPFGWTKKKEAKTEEEEKKAD
jgi:hypothetical protein